MPRDSAATRARILAAAIEEFAAHGLAGARIERIAEAAEANKRSLYVYFTDKQGLFDAALYQCITDLVTAVPLTEDDLPGYAGRMFDYHLARPHAFRMSVWRQLECPDTGPYAGDVYAHKIQAMTRARATATGHPIPPVDLLVLIIGLTTSWLLTTPDLLTADGADPHAPARIATHRAAVIEAARRLCA
ncbi:TetR family transcriptional regulator [Streptomyces sp. NPDC054933]